MTAIFLKKQNSLLSGRHKPCSSLKDNPQRAGIWTGFVLSALLLGMIEVLYKIPFRHALALDPQVFSVKIPTIDDRIPVIPVFFLAYIWAFVYWFFAPFFIVKTGKEKTLDFVTAFTVSVLLCSLILYFFPTKIDRVAEGLWDPSRQGFFWTLLRIGYNVDGGSTSYSLLPSLHCTNSVLYYQAMRNEKIPRKVRWAALVSTVLIVLSTLFTKQHFFLDAVTGVLLPVIVRPAVTSVRRLLHEREQQGLRIRS